MTLGAPRSTLSPFQLSQSPSIISRMSGLVHSYPDDKYSDRGLSDKEYKALNSNIPDDGPALLLMNYDIVFVVSRPKFPSTNPHCPFCSTGRRFDIHETGTTTKPLARVPGRYIRDRTRSHQIRH